MQARFYLPMYGRFASPDPARDQHFEQTQSWNIYSYVQNNPVMNTDPTGMWVSGTHLFGLIPDGHGKIIKAAWEQRYGSDFVKTATSANEKFDMATQSVPESGLHSMTPGGPGDKAERTESGEQQMESHVSKYVELAAQAGANGDDKAKAENMAIGSHPIADSTSPSHGFQKEWGGVVDVATGVKAVVHVLKELFVPAKKVDETAAKLNQFADRVEARQKELLKERENVRAN